MIDCTNYDKKRHNPWVIRHDAYFKFWNNRGLYLVYEPGIHVARFEYLKWYSMTTITLIIDLRQPIPTGAYVEVTTTMHFKPHGNQTMLFVSFFYI